MVTVTRRQQLAMLPKLELFVLAGIEPNRIHKIRELIDVIIAKEEGDS